MEVGLALSGSIVDTVVTPKIRFSYFKRRVTLDVIRTIAIDTQSVIVVNFLLAHRRSPRAQISFVLGLQLRLDPFRDSQLRSCLLT